MKEHGIKIVGDKGLYSKKDLEKIERQLKEGEEDLKETFFDDAETNQDINIYPDIIGFEDKLENIGTDLDELRKNQNKPLIPDELIASAINVYIENALEISKHENLLDVSGWDSLDTGSNLHSSNEERRLMDQKIKTRRVNRKKDDYGFYPGKEDREKGLVSLAESGNLFHIDLNKVYKSVGETQVKNFGKMYGTNYGM